MGKFVCFCMVLALAVPRGMGAAPSPPDDTSRDRQVRISLFNLFAPASLDVKPASEAVLRAASGGDIPLAPGDLVRLRLAGGALRVTLSDAYGRPRRQLTAARVEVLPAGAAAFELILPGKLRRTVRGALAVTAHRSRPALTVVLTTDRETAVASAVAAEGRGRRHPELLRALAIMARTYTVAHPERHADEGADLCDNTHCQLYQGEPGPADAAVAAAAAATAGQVLSYGGRALAGFYTAACGGLTATPQMVWGGLPPDGYPYRRVACRWCRGSDYYRWRRAAGVAEAHQALAAALGRRVSPAAEILPEHDATGFVRAVVLADGGRRARLTADEFRRAIGRRLGWNTVRSPSFTVARRGHRYVFSGRGFGSQAGLCVAGAAAQAGAGRGWRDILLFYFPGAVIADA